MTREELIARILQTDRTLRPARIDELLAAEHSAFAINTDSDIGALAMSLRNEILKRDREVPEPPEGGG